MRFELENTPRNAQAPVFLEIDYVDMCLGGSDFFKVGLHRRHIGHRLASVPGELQPSVRVNLASILDPIWRSADRLQGLRIERLALRRDRLEDHLEAALEVEAELRLLLGG